MPKRDWPQLTDIDTSSLDSQADRPNRVHFLNAFEAIWSIVRARGRAGGIAGLNASGRVEDDQLGLNRAWGVPQLDAHGKLAGSRLPPEAVPGAIPIGGMLPIASGGSGLEGDGVAWAHCDGRWLDKAGSGGFPDLWSHIGDRHLNGETARPTQFRIPDMRGRVLIGHAGGGAGLTNRVAGQTGGAETVTLAAANAPRHRHHIATGTYADAPAGGIDPSGANSMHIRRNVTDNSEYYLSGAAGEPTALLSSWSGAENPAPVRIEQPWICVEWIIRTR